MKLAVLLFLSVACAAQDLHLSADGCSLVVKGHERPIYRSGCPLVFSSHLLPQDLMPLPEPTPPLLAIRYNEATYEPVDVPAIQEQKEVKTGAMTCKVAPECAGKGISCNVVSCTEVTVKRTITTCADKSRILLTDEQGGKHCVKF